MSRDGRATGVQVLPRSQIDDASWNACVADASRSIVYGYTWYLDAVLPAGEQGTPSWKWVGLVIPNQDGGYSAVMPVPMRRKGVAGIARKWVVHQPLFCQMLGVFSRNPAVDPALFWRAIQQHFRYGSIFSVRQRPAVSAGFDPVQTRTTHVLDLSVGYEALVQRYSRDRRLNLRRAERAGWTLVEDTNPEPLLALFRQHHADGIDGGVAEWAYVIFRNLVQELQKRAVATLRYAVRDGRIEAGALFVQEGGRIIYLFNAASEAGRRGNARTLLLDQMIRQHAGRPVWFDFESPEKPSIAEFYQSFGAVAEPFWAIRWNRMNFMEKSLLRLKQRFS